MCTPASLSPGWGGGGRQSEGQEGPCTWKGAPAGQGMGWSQETDARSQHMPRWHLRGAGGVWLSGAWDRRQGLQGCDMRRSRALPTHLAEAAKAERCSFVERKVSHCRRQERGSVSLGQGAAPEPQAVSIALCAAGPSGLATDGLGGLWPPTPFLPTPSGSLTDPQKQHVCRENPPLPQPSLPGHPEAGS